MLGRVENGGALLWGVILSIIAVSIMLSIIAVNIVLSKSCREDVHVEYLESKQSMSDASLAWVRNSAVSFMIQHCSVF